MDKINIINILGKDIEVIETQIKLLNESVVGLNEKLGGFKKTYSLLLKEEEDMAREIIKESIKVIQLKNGQVNVPYEEIVNLEEFNIPSDAALDFDGIEQIKWNNKESKFEGELKTPGEFYGKLSFWKNDSDKKNGKPKLERQVHILVNADPKSLWKNIPPPLEGPFFKENTCFSFEKSNEKVLLGASIRGKSHAQKGTFRDDDFEIHSFENDWFLQIVSDGAGSAEYSREGSKVACRAVASNITNFIESDKIKELEGLISKVDSLKKEKEVNFKGEKAGPKENDKQFDIENSEVESSKQLLSKLIHEITVVPAHSAYNKIKELSEDTKYSIKKFSSTILFALSKEFDFGTVVISFSIGDGAIGVITEKEGVLLMTPDGGEYSGQTRFVTMGELFKSKEIHKRSSLQLFKDKIEAIILMSDGISDPKFGTDNNLKASENWLNFWKELKPVLTKDEIIEKEVLEWMDFHEKGEYDDRTLTILY